MRRSQEYPSYPEIEDALGYNPARFLNHAIESTSCTTDLTVKSLIRGIKEISTIRAWIEIEVDLGRDGGGPRREIIKQLNRRQAQLENDAAPVDGATADEPTESTEAEPASQTTAPAETDKRDEPAELSEPSKPSQLSQPDTTPSTGATQEDPVLADGGEETTPKCSECRGELTPEEVGDETAHWCAHCGGFRELLGGAA